MMGILQTQNKHMISSPKTSVHIHLKGKLLKI